MKPVKLGTLMPGQSGRIVAVGRGADGSALVQRLLEMGFLEGSQVEVVHQAPFSGDPLAVRVRGALLALRRAEADWVEVEV